MNYNIKNAPPFHHNALCRRTAWLLALGVGLSLEASGQATSGAIVIKTIVEVQVQVKENGRALPKLVPAGRLVIGDQVVCTLEVRNASRSVEPPPTVTNPVPEHMRYIADSAAGPGAEVTYSVDGGRRFDRPDALTVVGVNGQKHLASAADYTHIRWQLKNSLKAGSVAFVRFRAIVK